MISHLPLLSFLLFGRSIFAQSAIDKAIEPTASGQIGINPVDSPETETVVESHWLYIHTLPDYGTSIANIEAHTRYLTSEAGTISWIGSNSEYFTDTVATATISGTTVTATDGVAVSIATAATGSGDYSVAIAPALFDEIKNIAAAECTGGSRHKRTLHKRALVCSLNFQSRVVSAYDAYKVIGVGLTALQYGTIGAVIAVVAKQSIELGEEIPWTYDVKGSDMALASTSSSVITNTITKPAYLPEQTSASTTTINSSTTATQST